MKRLLLTAVSALTIAGAAVLVSALDHRSPYAQGAGGYENASKRLEMELMMLRDPATGRIPDGIRAAELAHAATMPTREDEPLLSKSGRAMTYTWTPRGPNAIGGRTRAFAVDITGEDTMLAGGVSGGLWRSTDAGATWSRTTLPTQLQSVSAIAQDPRPGRTATWYYGSGELVGNSASGGGAFFHGDGMFKSTDNGITWASLQSTASATPHLFDKVFDNIWRIAVDPSSTAADVVYAAMYGTISRSTNGGVSWRTSVGGPEQLAGSTRYSGYFTDVAVTKTGVAYATISSDGWKRGIWRTANGTAWTQLAPPDLPETYRRIVIGITPQNENVVYFLAETPGTGALGRNFRGDSSWSQLWRYTYVSGDGTGAGGRWENLTANIPLFGPPHGDFFTQGSYDMLVEVDPWDSSRVLIGGTNLYLSTTAFTTNDATKWIGGYQNTKFDSTVIVELEYPRHHPDLHRAQFSPTRRDVLFTASDGGVHRTDMASADSVSWVSLNRGYRTSQFYTVAIDHATAGSDLIVGGMQDNGTWMTSTSDHRADWLRLGTGDGSFAAIADRGASLYVSKQLGKTYRVVRDAGGAVTASTRIDPLGAKEYLFINPFVLDPSDQRVMYLAGGVELWRNTDVTAIPMGSTQPATLGWSRLANRDSLFITAIAATTVSPSHRVYYGTHNGLVYRIESASSGDQASAEITSEAFPEDAYVSCIAVDPLDGDRAIVVFSNYSVQSLYLTTDAGGTWTPISGNLETTLSGAGAGPSCRWAAFLHRPNETVILVGTSTGLYSTTHLDGSKTRWYREGASDLGNAVIKMIDVRQSDGFVAVATHGNGVWATTIALADADGEETAGSSLIESIAPNPITERSILRLRVPPSIGGDVARIRLYDVRGALVATLHEGPLDAGTHAIRLGRAAAGRVGQLFCRIEFGSRVETRSITVRRP